MLFNRHKLFDGTYFRVVEKLIYSAGVRSEMVLAIFFSRKKFSRNVTFFAFN